ncbi:head GIN domain-containing protein [Natronoflexus pectinivorans]|uniref:Putative autotransporter adhesin-like protein n=1 Tax=Natronoflexus pectinivorans TaxID=682526 RepID=A0A4R2GMB8_9BACT|nr:head GIN domain-containing protein [Natronoflexus pectinivorans]TCO08743.1 putative autotransporter adhesin-like protein [Natronoflexus pectinivorans]
MKKINSILIDVALVFVNFCSCVYATNDNDRLLEQDRQVTPFHAIAVSSGIELLMTQGNEHSVVVVAKESVIDRIKTDSKNGKLVIGVDNRRRGLFRSSRTGPIKVYVSFTRLDELTVSSGAQAKSDDLFELHDFQIKASSGAFCRLNINCKSLRVDASSGANVNIQGNSEIVRGSASSGANISGTSMESQEADLSASSGGNVSFTVTEKVVAKASSGGRVALKGNATSTSFSSSSGGVINQE